MENNIQMERKRKHEVCFLDTKILFTQRGQHQHLHQPDRDVNYFGNFAVGKKSNSGKETFLEPSCKAKTWRRKCGAVLWRRLLRAWAWTLVWFESVNEALQELGYRQLKVEPCCWVWADSSGVIKSMIHSHVENLMFAGKEQSSIHQGLMDKLKAKFNWGSWEETEFIQCGIHVKQKEDYSIELSQEKYIDGLEEIYVSRDRARLTEATITEEERKQLRTALGGVASNLFHLCSGCELLSDNYSSGDSQWASQDKQTHSWYQEDPWFQIQDTRLSREWRLGIGLLGRCWVG